MSFIRKQTAKLVIAMARPTISIGIDNAAKALKEGRYADALKEMQAVHQSGLNILVNVCYLEGFEYGNEALALSLLDTLPKYEKERQVLGKAFAFMAQLENQVI